MEARTSADPDALGAPNDRFGLPLPMIVGKLPAAPIGGYLRVRVAYLRVRVAVLATDGSPDGPRRPVAEDSWRVPLSPVVRAEGLLRRLI